MSFHTLQTLWPRERRAGRLQRAGPGVIPISLSPTLCGPRRLPPLRARCVYVEHVGGEGAVFRRLWAVGGFQRKHTGPGTQGTSFAHRQSQFLARSLSLSVQKTVPKGLRPPGRDLSSRGGLVTPHCQVQVLAVPLRVVLPPAGGTASQLPMCPLRLCAASPVSSPSGALECLCPQFCRPVGNVSLLRKLRLKPHPSSGRTLYVRPSEHSLSVS